MSEQRSQGRSAARAAGEDRTSVLPRLAEQAADPAGPSRGPAAADSPRRGSAPIGGQGSGGADSSGGSGRGGRPTLPRTPRSAPPAPPAARGRRARLRLRRVDPWSVFLLSLVTSLFLALAIVVAVVALYAVLAAAGVPDSLNQLFAEVTARPGAPRPAPLITASRAITTAGVLALVYVVLITALSTLGALLYNVCASFTGGVELTLAEPDER